MNQDLDRFLINALLALSAYVTLQARLLSLANAGFMALGAYVSAILAAKLGCPLLVSIPAAIVFCGASAWLLGLPVLKLNDVYLAIATLGFGEVVRILIILNPDLTGGPTGANLSTGFPYALMKQTQTWMLLAAVIFVCYLFQRMARSRTGRAFRALRENPVAASTMGIDVVGSRSLAFVMSAVLAGGAGALYAHLVGSLDSGDFRFNRAIEILSYAVLGGSGHWLGPLLGAGVLTALPLLLRDVLGASDFLKNFVQLPSILNGLALMLVILFLPKGLVSLFRRRRNPSPTSTVGSSSARTDSGSQTEPLLAVEGLSRVFGGLSALEAVEFQIRAGSICGLIGPNGAGKTTLVNLISGLLKPTAGRVLFRGRDLNGLQAFRRSRLGMARTYQNIQLFSEMSVLENVIVGRHALIKTNLASTWLMLPSERREEALSREEALALLKDLGLIDLAHQPAGKLSYGDQRRVEIARALASKPRLLLLDEPAAGMNESESHELADFLLELKRKGFTLLVIEHHMDLIMKICDHIVVLNFGQVIAQDVPSKIAAHAVVQEAYLGKD